MCLVEGCEKDVWSRGYCSGHYRQMFDGEKLRPLQEQHHGLSEYDRFMSWVTVAGPNDCWNWRASRIKKDWHGQWRNAAGQTELVHRAAWRLFKGDIPKGMFILHHCDNPICVNPSHLFMGSQSDNAKDMWQKRRANPGISIGEKHGMSKITADIVRAIRSSTESGVALAAKFGITATTVCDIRKRRTWNHIT